MEEHDLPGFRVEPPEFVSCQRSLLLWTNVTLDEEGSLLSPLDDLLVEVLKGVPDVADRKL